MKVHEIKLNTEFFDDVLSGVKTFEIRKNDREYRIGDLLAMSRHNGKSYLEKREGYYVDPKKAIHETDLHEADTIFARVVYISDYEQKEGYVILGIELREVVKFENSN